MKKLLRSLFVLMFIASSALAQNRTITGTVTSSEDGLPLPGVSVKVRGANIGASTGVNGKYTLAVPTSATALEFSSLGFITRTINIGTSSTIDAALTADPKSLTEVVVTGYGVQTKREVGGAIARVTGEQFENQPMASFEKALQGRAAGVQVTASNGIPGGAMNIQIRGVGSFTGGTQPLYIVDGVQMSASTLGGLGTQTNTLAGLNSNDIASIEVLKDAASTSIYGAQGANGVVIVTTKKGKAGVTKFGANFYTGFVDQLNEYNVLNSQEYYQMRTEAVQNFNPRFTPLRVRQTVLTEMGQPIAATDADIAAIPTYDWQDAIFKTGRVNNYELNATGGNEKTQFYASGSYQTSDATLTKVDFKRANFRINVDHKATEKLSFNTNISLSNIRQRSVPLGTDGSSLGNPAFAAPLYAPYLRIFNADGSYNSPLQGILNQNVLQVADYNDGLAKTNQLVGSVSATYKILPTLTFKSFASAEYNNIMGDNYRDPRTPDGATFNGLGQVYANARTNVQTTQTLTYGNQFGKHKIDGFVGFEYRVEQVDQITASGTGYPSYLFRNLSAAATPFGVGETYSGYRMLSYLGRAQYNYDDKYIVGVNFRYTGSSRFGANNKFGTFPGVTFVWNVDREDFMKDATWLSALKFRAGYGVTGSDRIGNFDALSLYGRNGLYNGITGIAPANLANPDLRWEKSTGLDLGIEYGLFGNRFTGSVGVYSVDNSDLLLDQTLSSLSGFGSITTNVGALTKKGIEVELTSNNFRSSTGGFNWATSFVFAYATNEITSLYDGLQQLPADVNTRVGSPLGSVFTFQYAGVNPATGRSMIYDVNNNLSYNTLPVDRRFVGLNFAPYTGGLNNSFSYKGIDFEFLLQYQYGQILSDGQETFVREVGTRAAFNTYREAYERRWTTPGQITDIPRPYNGGQESGGNIGRFSGTAGFQPTDYIRLRTVQLGYNFPKSLLNKARLSNLRLYAQGTNLLTWTNFDGYDPEFSGTALGIIPQSKNITFGIQVGF
jgi:TonB-dependent starch-binding outer membrane protein SusC